LSAAPARIAIVASERGPNGARLVALDEHGDRQFELLQPAAQLARDSHPVVSPDGRWVVFASSRERQLDETSLWIAPLQPDATPVRLTQGSAIDTQPAWSRDGRWIVFASTRARGNYDLYRLAIDAGGRPGGSPEMLTSADTHEIAPTVGSDGSIVFEVLAAHDDHTVDSHLERRGPDGTIVRLSDGPGDSSPALSPDGETLAFVRPVARNGRELDAELWTMPAGGGQPTRLVDLPQTDEGGPVWSLDGRYLFATSLLRGESGKPLFSSVIVVDTRAPQRVARILEDRVGPIARLTPAIAAPRLDAAALASDPEYVPELARIIAAAIAAQRQDPP
jgi:Tol biopolymer transport system component